MTKHSLITMWDDKKRSQEQIEWDIILLPLLFGPISILDSMCIDAIGFISAIQKDWVNELIKKYVQIGLLKLYHRHTYEKNREIKNLQDLLMIWLSRTDDRTNWTVALSFLSDDQNKELRDIIKKEKDKTIRERCDRFIEFVGLGPDGIPGYEYALQRMSELFFKSKYESREIFKFFPSKPIQVRVLEAAGVKDAGDKIKKAHETKRNVLDLLHDNEFGSSLVLSAEDIDWRLFMEQARKDSSSQDFFRKITSISDIGRLCFARSAREIELFDGKAGQLLECLVNASFVCGIPEANNQFVLWPQSDPRSELESSVVGDSKARKSIGREIIKALGDERCNKLRSLLQRETYYSTKSKDIRNIIKDLQSIIFGEHSKKMGAFGHAVSAAGVAILGALTLSQIPQLYNYIQGNHGIVAQWAIQYSGLGLTTPVVSKVVSKLYPKFLGRSAMYGKYGASFYRGGLQLVDEIEILNADDVINAPAPLFIQESLVNTDAQHAH